MWITKLCKLQAAAAAAVVVEYLCEQYSYLCVCACICATRHCAVPQYSSKGAAKGLVNVLKAHCCNNTKESKAQKKRFQENRKKFRSSKRNLDLNMLHVACSMWQVGGSCKLAATKEMWDNQNGAHVGIWVKFFVATRRGSHRRSGSSKFTSFFLLL